MWYSDTWISIIRILKKLKYPSIQLSKRIEISEYPSIRIVTNLRYPTIHVSWILGYMDVSNYPCIQVFMDSICLLMDKLQGVYREETR